MSALGDAARLGRELTATARQARGVPVMVRVALLADALAAHVALLEVADDMAELRDTLAASSTALAAACLAVACRWSGVRA